MATIFRHFYIKSGPLLSPTKDCDWDPFQNFMSIMQEELGCYSLVIFRDGPYGLFLHDETDGDQANFDKVNTNYFVKKYSYTTYLGLSFRLHKVKAMTQKNQNQIRSLLENMQRFSQYFCLFHEQLIALNNDYQKTQVQYLIKYNQVLPIISMQDTIKNNHPMFEPFGSWVEIPASVMDQAVYEDHDAPFDLSIGEWLESCCHEASPDWSLLSVIDKGMARYNKLSRKSTKLKEHNKVATFLDLAKRARLPIEHLIHKHNWS